MARGTNRLRRARICGRSSPYVGAMTPRHANGFTFMGNALTLSIMRWRRISAGWRDLLPFCEPKKLPSVGDLEDVVHGRPSVYRH